MNEAFTAKLWAILSVYVGVLVNVKPLFSRADYSSLIRTQGLIVTELGSFVLKYLIIPCLHVWILDFFRNLKLFQQILISSRLGYKFKFIHSINIVYLFLSSKYVRCDVPCFRCSISSLFIVVYQDRVISAPKIFEYCKRYTILACDSIS